MKDCFLFLNRGPGPSTGYPLLGEVTIGSSPDNTICLDDEAIAPEHAVVSFQEGAWTVEDLQSANSIIFKGNPVNRVVTAVIASVKVGMCSHLLPSWICRMTGAATCPPGDPLAETPA